MPWAIFLLLLLSYCSGVTSQPVLTQRPTQSEALGKPVRLTCTLSSGYESYVISWHQQSSGQPPRLLMNTDGSKVPGVPDRFSASKSGGERHLNIAGVQAEDEATYYCGADHGSV